MKKNSVDRFIYTEDDSKGLELLEIKDKNMFLQYIEECQKDPSIYNEEKFNSLKKASMEKNKDKVEEIQIEEFENDEQDCREEFLSQFGKKEKEDGK